MSTALNQQQNSSYTTHVPILISIIRHPNLHPSLHFTTCSAIPLPYSSPRIKPRNSIPSHETSAKAYKSHRAGDAFPFLAVASFTGSSDSDFRGLRLMLLLKLRLMLRFSWGLGLSFLRELGSLLGLHHRNSRPKHTSMHVTHHPIEGRAQLLFPVPTICMRYRFIQDRMFSFTPTLFTTNSLHIQLSPRHHVVLNYLRLSDALRDDRFTSPRSRLKLLLRLRLRLGLRRLEPRPLSLSRSLSRQSSS